MAADHAMYAFLVGYLRTGNDFTSSIRRGQIFVKQVLHIFLIIAGLPNGNPAPFVAGGVFNARKVCRKNKDKSIRFGQKKKAFALLKLSKGGVPYPAISWPGLLYAG